MAFLLLLLYKSQKLSTILPSKQLTKEMNGQSQNKQDNNHSSSNESLQEEQMHQKQDNGSQQNIDKQEQLIKEKEQKDPLQNGAQNKLSKKQIKKMKQKQKWEQMRKIKRKQQKEKQKLKKLEKKENEQGKQAKKQMGEIVPQKKRKQQYKQKMLDGQKVVIDLQFYDLMTEKQQNSLCKQLAYCHSVNRKFKIPFNYILTSATQPRVKFLHDKFNILNFGITILDKDILSCFDRQKIVYLTGDAEEELKQFSKEQVYVIGGIVDHNRLKNITINYANQKGIKARRLPMEGIRLKASVHLAVNHVWEWMLRFENGQSWKQAIQAVIPERKLQEIEKGQSLQ